MEKLKACILDEVDLFREKFNGSKIATEILEAMPGFGTWMDHKKQMITDYYKTIHREEKISMYFSKGSFKIRLAFLKDGEIEMNIDYTHTSNVKIKEKTVMQEYVLDPGYVYFLESEFGWKIGKTRDLKRRFRIFDVKLPFKFAVRYIIKTHLMNDLEKHFHVYFKDKNLNGEWFLIRSEDIIDSVSKMPEYKLKRYHQESSHLIDKKYLTLIEA
jgi:hypothetical protein